MMAKKPAAKEARSSTPTSAAMRGREKELKGAESGGVEKFEERSRRSEASGKRLCALPMDEEISERRL